MWLQISCTKYLYIHAHNIYIHTFPGVYLIHTYILYLYIIVHNRNRHRHGWTLLAVHCLGTQLRLLQSGKVGQIGRRNDSRKAGGESPATPFGMNEFRGIRMEIFVLVSQISVGIFFRHFRCSVVF